MSNTDWQASGDLGPKIPKGKVNQHQNSKKGATKIRRDFFVGSDE